MLNPVKSRSNRGTTIIRFLVEAVVYAVFILAYYFLVLHFLRGWIKDIFDHHKNLYAFAALALIVAQAFVLELVTAGLARLTQGKMK